MSATTEIPFHSSMIVSQFRELTRLKAERESRIKRILKSVSNKHSLKRGYPYAQLMMDGNRKNEIAPIFIRISKVILRILSHLRKLPSNHKIKIGDEKITSEAWVGRISEELDRVRFRISGFKDPILLVQK